MGYGTDFRNRATFIGMVKSKDRKFDNIDIKRPVVDFETVIIKDDGNIEFSKVAGVFSQNDLARSVSGIAIGEIFQVTGTVHADERQDSSELYIEIESYHRISEKKRSVSIQKSQAELLEWRGSGDMVTFVGQVTEYSGCFANIKIKRDKLVRGDLKDYDNITVDVERFTDIKKGDNVRVVGTLYPEYIKAGCIEKLA